MEKLEVRIWDKEFRRMKLSGAGFNQGVLCGENVEILLCSGITDCNGRIKIYVGDIMESRGEVDYPSSVVCFGEYKSEEPLDPTGSGIGFYLKSRKGIRPLSKTLVDNCDLVAIDNIYELPELNPLGDCLSPEC